MEQIYSTYNGEMVAISIVAAILSSYVALELANIASDWRTKRIFNKWLLVSALALGLGIWTMHFIGMFALQLPIPIYYEGWLTIASLLFAVTASFIGFSIVHRNNDFRWSIVGGVVMGLGIASMHYIGMAAMRLRADMHYDLKLVLLSVLIAILVSILALWTVVTMKAGIIAKNGFMKIVTAILMGAAISSMHYTGVAAMTLSVNDNAVIMVDGFLIAGTPMVATLAIAAIFLILFPLLSVNYENRFSRRVAAELVLLRSNESRLRKLIENAPDAYFVHNEQGQILDVNRKACEQLGYGREELLALKIFDIAEADDFEENIKRIWPSLEAGHGYTIRTTHIHKNGSKYPVEVNITGLADNGSRQMFALARDITETEKLRVHLSKLAMTDELTNLYNRRAFLLALDKEFASSSRGNRKLSMLMLDIDYFKKINDKYGHQIGDITLQHFAKIVTNSIRTQDTLGRVGGEEFAIILPDTDLEDAKILAERIRVAAEKTSIVNNIGDIQFTVSIGIACLSGRSDSAKALLNNADKALYEAKGGGRNQVSVFNE